MSAEAGAEPAVPRSLRRIPAPSSVNTTVASWARAFLSRSSRVAAVLEIIGAIAIVSVLPLRHWPRPAMVVLAVAAAAAAVIAGVRATIGWRLPRSSLQVDVGIGTLLVSVVTAASASEHVDLANLYLLVVFFAILYLPLGSALAHTAAAGTAYAVVLGVGPAPGEPPAIAWLAVFGTAAVLGAVVLGLVSVLRVAAREDPLTGLASRRLWDERLEEELERSRRSGMALSVVMVDIDGLKAVNDAGGHEAGDLLLREFASAWQAVIRGSGDLLARLGGDEFGIIAPGSDEIGIRRLVERLVHALPEGISASVGVATWDGNENASHLLRRADRAMYQTKRRRRAELRRA